MASGYDSKFVETPPDDYTCMICHCVARDPQQIQCCAKLYCKACLDLQRRTTNRCPTCRGPIYSFPDKLNHRRIKALKVSCDNEANGCTWAGELGSLEAHSAECEFTWVPCPNNCSTPLFRRYLRSHLTTQCPQREYRCPKCGQRGKYCDMTTTHLEECPNVVISCPNMGCRVTMKRCVLSTHRRSCPKEVVKCTYAKVGCEEVMVREKRKEHETDSVEEHLKLAVDTLDSKVRALQVVPVVLKVPDFSELMDTNTEWYSEEFYSHRGGYKMTLHVNANGDGEDNDFHVSVYIHLSCGEYDDNLVWPFDGTITIQLLNQLADLNHKTMSLNMSGTDAGTERPPKGGRNSGYGWHNFVSHAQLEHGAFRNFQYLKDDCLYFRVSKVVLKPTNKPWLHVAV